MLTFVIAQDLTQTANTKMLPFVGNLNEDLLRFISVNSAKYDKNRCRKQKVCQFSNLCQALHSLPTATPTNF